jgi:predicted Zn-ribbon and HTH transcriptional regulator
MRSEKRKYPLMEELRERELDTRKDNLQRLAGLEQQIREKQEEVYLLKHKLGIPIAVRPRWHCLRCDYDWNGHPMKHAPRHCPRCHSTGWDTERMFPKRSTKKYGNHQGKTTTSSSQGVNNPSLFSLPPPPMAEIRSVEDLPQPERTITDHGSSTLDYQVGPSPGEQDQQEMEAVRTMVPTPVQADLDSYRDVPDDFPLTDQQIAEGPDPLEDGGETQP